MRWALLYYVYLTASFFFFFFNDTATTEIYTLSLHDALPIYVGEGDARGPAVVLFDAGRLRDVAKAKVDRKSTRLNSSHSQISYAVFCLKKKNRVTRKLSLNSLTADMNCIRGIVRRYISCLRT